MSKILIVVTDTNVGGVTTAVYNFINELCKRDNDVTFLDFSAKRENPNIHKQAQQIFLKGKERYWKLGKENVAGAPLIKKPLLLLLGILKKFTIKGGLWNKLIFSKLDGDYDVAIAYRQCAPCYSFVLNKVNAKKKIGFVHGDVDYMGDISSWQPMMTRFNKISYVSNAVKEGFIKKYPELRKNACTIYNMVNIERIQELAQEKNDYCLDKNVFNIVTVSRISNEEKRIDWIPKICKETVKREIRNFHWYIIGDGNDLQKNIELSIELGVDSYITFVGKTDNPYNIMCKANVFVLPTRNESYGLAVVESLILGVPVVVCRYPAVGEVFENKKYGFVAEQNIENVTDKIQLFLKDIDTYNQIKKNCENYAFSNDLSYNQFLEAVRDEER